MNTVSFDLDVTVDHHAFRATYGEDPRGILAENVAHDARFAARLLDLLPDRDRQDGADVQLVEFRHGYTDTIAHWTTVRMTLSVRVDAQEWTRRWGVRPLAALGSYLAAELMLSKPMAEEVSGTVVYVPESARFQTR